jgi:hypothetical protein
VKKLYYLLFALFFPVGALMLAGGSDYVAKPAGIEIQAANFTGGGPSNLFPRMKGTYNGLALPTNEFVAEYSGFFTLNIDSDRYFDGWMNVGDNRYPLGGRFDNQGHAGVTIYKQVWDDCYCYSYLLLVWVVNLRLIQDTDEIEGNADNVSHGWRTQLFGYRAFGKEDESAPQMGRYTLRLPSNADPAVAPPGEGHGLVKVDSRGRVEAYGALADGTAYSRSSAISTNGWWPFYFPMSNGRGALIGWLNFSSTAGSDVAGDLTWVRPVNEDRKYYPNGYIGTVAASGSRYVPPSSSTLALTWTNGIFRLTGGDLSMPVTNSVTLLPGGKMINNGGGLSKLSFSLSRSTGKINGTFTHPDSGKKTSYYGVLDQLQDIGAGYFLGSSQGGLIRLEAAP